jgi:hypothetical protein
MQLLERFQIGGDAFQRGRLLDLIRAGVAGCDGL